MIKNKIKDSVNLINFISVLLLVFVLILNKYNIQEKVYYVFFTSYVVEFFTDKKWKNITFSRQKIYFLVILFFFSLALIYYPFEKSDHYYKLLIERRYPLLGFSVVGFFGVNRFYKLRYFIISIVITSISIIAYLLFFKVGIHNFIKDDNLFNIARAEYVNTHMIVNFYFNSAILGVWYLLSKYWNKINIYLKILMIISVFVILYALSISEGRTGFLFGLIMTILLAFGELWKKKKRYGLLFAFIIPWLAIVLITTHRRMDYNEIKSEPRFFLWESGLSVVKDKPILGYGMSTAQVHFDAAREIYQTQSYKEGWIMCKHLDSHNQFIQTWMEFGIFGLFILLFIYIAPVFLVIKRRRYLTLLFISLSFFQSFFDMFATGFFSAIFCLWIVFLLSTTENKNKGKRLESPLTK